MQTINSLWWRTLSIYHYQGIFLGPLDPWTHTSPWGCAAHFKTMELMEEGRPTGGLKGTLNGNREWGCDQPRLWPIFLGFYHILSTKVGVFTMTIWLGPKKIMLCLLCLNMFAANPRFARGESRISFDILKSLRRVTVFSFQSKNPKTLKPQTLNPKSKP